MTNKLIIADATRKKSWLDEIWVVAATWNWLRNDAQGNLGAIDWNEIVDWLLSRGEIEPITEIQYWGHGGPGYAHVGSKSINQHMDRLFELRSVLAPDCLFWLRTCSSFRGEAGQEFARRLTDALGCRVAAHTYKIGFPYHSGLHSLMPGQDPYWPLREGEKKNGTTKWSQPFAPNTINMFQGDLPEGY